MRRSLSSFFAAAALLVVASAAATPRDNEALAFSQAAIGRNVGDWTFVDHTGRTVKMSDFRGKPVVVNFIYTGCFQVCPTTTQFLKRAVAAAGDALGRGSFRVVSIGFNQPADSPEALAAFARQQGVDHPNWSLLAPRDRDVPALLAEFGMRVERNAGGFDHLIQASIVAADGRIYRQVYGDSFELPQFVAPLRELLSGQAAQALTLENVWTKVKLYCTVYDPTSGKYKLDYSLFMELFAGLTFLGAVAAFVLREFRRAEH
jgi:protein SCO1/2